MDQIKARCGWEIWFGLVPCADISLEAKDDRSRPDGPVLARYVEEEEIKLAMTKTVSQQDVREIPSARSSFSHMSRCDEAFGLIPGRWKRRA
jgi:hypothetical protein